MHKWPHSFNKIVFSSDPLKHDPRNELTYFNKPNNNLLFVPLKNITSWLYDDQIYFFEDSTIGEICYHALYFPIFSRKITIEGNVTSVNYNNCSHRVLDFYYEEEYFDGITCTNPCQLECTVRHEIEIGGPSKMTFGIYFVLRVLATMAMSSCWTMLVSIPILAC